LLNFKDLKPGSIGRQAFTIMANKNNCQFKSLRHICRLFVQLALIVPLSLSYAESDSKILKEMNSAREAASAFNAEVYPQIGPGQILNLAFSPDGKTIISGGLNQIKLWDAASGRELRTLAKGTIGIFSPDGQTIATIDKTPSVDSKNEISELSIWNFTNGRRIRTLANGGEVFDESLSFSSDGLHITNAAGGDSVALGGGITIWEITSGKRKVVSGPTYRLSKVINSPDGRTFVRTGLGVEIWDATTGKNLRTIDDKTFDRDISAAYSPDSRTIVTGTEKGFIKIWDVASGRKLNTLSGHNNSVKSGGSTDVTSVSFSPDGRTVLSGSSDSTLKLWDVTSGVELRTLSGNTSVVIASGFSPDGNIIFSGGYDESIRLWDVSSGQKLMNIGRNAYEITATDISRDGRLIVSSSSDNIITIWDATNGHVLRTLVGHKKPISQVALSPDGQTIASISEEGIKFWSVSSGKELHSLTLNGAQSIAFSPDNRTLVSGAEYNIFSNTNMTFKCNIKLWDVFTGKEVRTISDSCPRAMSVAYSPDGSAIVSAGINSNPRIWDPTTPGKEPRVMHGYKHPIKNVAFSSDGLTVVSKSFDGSLNRWSSATDQEITAPSSINVSEAFLSNKMTAVIGDSDGTTKILNVASGKVIAKFVRFKDGEWISVTTEGYYASSGNGAKYLNIRFGNRVMGLDQFYDVFYRPDIVEAKLKGEDIRGLITLTIDQALKNPPPVVSFTKVPSTTNSNSEKVCYSAIAQGGGIGEIRLFQSGKLIKSDGFYREAKNRESNSNIKLAAMDSTSITRALRLTVAAETSDPKAVYKSKGDKIEECQEVETIPGENEISVAAFNGNNTIQSRLVTSTFKSDRTQEDPRLYVLGIGINKYQDEENNLKYAVKDAADFREMIGRKAKGLFKPENILVEGLIDADATKSGIQNAIQSIAIKAKPWDSFILFVASHGALLDNQYYIVTADFDGTINTDKMISSNEIVGMSKNIKSLTQLMIFDTCHAGGVDNIISGLYDARMSVMANKMGLHIFASAGSTQTALDGYQGNGLFTHALLESMNDSVATDSNQDKEVSVAELGAQAKKETLYISKQLGFPQSPNIINFGKDNALFKIQ